MSPCHCTGHEYSPNCTTAVDKFCGAESECANSLENARRKVSSWLDTDFAPVYEECDDGTARIHVAWGGENDERLVFEQSSGALSYGHADGYVSSFCGRDVASLCWNSGTGAVTEAIASPGAPNGETCSGITLDVLSVEAGSAPATTTCRGCRVRSATSNWNEGGAGGQGGASGEGSRLPFCVVDASGQVALP